MTLRTKAQAAVDAQDRWDGRRHGELTREIGLLSKWLRDNPEGEQSPEQVMRAAIMNWWDARPIGYLPNDIEFALRHSANEPPSKWEPNGPEAVRCFYYEHHEMLWVYGRNFALLFALHKHSVEPRITKPDNNAMETAAIADEITTEKARQLLAEADWPEGLRAFDEVTRRHTIPAKSVEPEPVVKEGLTTEEVPFAVASHLAAVRKAPITCIQPSRYNELLAAEQERDRLMAEVESARELLDEYLDNQAPENIRDAVEALGAAWQAMTCEVVRKGQQIAALTAENERLKGELVSLKETAVQSE